MNYNNGNLPVQRTSKPIFTYEQEVCLQLMALPKRGGYTLAQIADQAGVNEKTLRRWRSSETFQRELQRRVMMNVSEFLADVMDTTVKKATQGSAKHTELVLKSLGVLKDQHIVIPAQPETDFDPRSDEAIDNEIIQLKRMLNEINPGYEDVNDTNENE